MDACCRPLHPHNLLIIWNQPNALAGCSLPTRWNGYIMIQDQICGTVLYLYICIYIERYKQWPNKQIRYQIIRTKRRNLNGPRILIFLSKTKDKMIFPVLDLYVRSKSKREENKVQSPKASIKGYVWSAPFNCSMELPDL